MNQQFAVEHWALSVGDRAQMQHWMEQCRQHTLSLFTNIDHDTFCRQAHPDFSPIGWHLGHIAYTEGLWLLEHLAGAAPQLPEYRRLFAADVLPKRDRVNLPPLSEVQTYLAVIREKVLIYLEAAPLAEQQRLWLWLLQHESQHGETIAIVLALQGRRWPEGERQRAAGSRQQGDMIRVPAGEFELGSESLWALDNERPVQRIYLEDFWIDRAPIACGEYRQFMVAGGYENARWWSKQGWAWLQANSITQPLYWNDDAAWDDRPVCGVNWYEAEAYAQFVGKRLPTEAEWEKAMRSFPHLHSAPGDRVWEWTSTWFAGYPEFEAYPYRGYSQAYFDGQHRVLRGGSWVTQPWGLRPTFRNWYYPHVREIFAGFRCAAS
jgi:ergothioneine biosynthesis protein EgtB